MPLTTTKLRLAGAGFVEPGPTPNAPSGLSASSVTPTTIGLTWKDNSRIETGFLVAQCDGISCDLSTPSATYTPGANVITQAITGLTEDTYHSFRVRATNGSGDSAWSTLTNVLTRLSAPTGGSISNITNSGATINFTDTSGAESGFEVQVSPDLSFSTITSSASETSNKSSISFIGLDPDTNYYARVRAVKASNNNYSEWLVSAQFTSGPAGYIPVAPSNVTYSAITTDGFTVNWIDNSSAGPTSSNEDEFEIGVYSDSGFTVAVTFLTSAADTTSKVVTGLDPNTEYWVQVRATNALGSSAWAQGAGQVTGIVPTIPGAVSYTSITTGGFTVNWSDSNFETSYEIQIATDAGFVTVVQNTTATANATSKAITGLSNWTSYWARVRSVNAFGNSAYSTGAEQKTAFTPQYFGTGLALWFDASTTANMTKDGSNRVSVWNNGGSGGVNAVQGSAALQPLYVTTGGGGIDFTGTRVLTVAQSLTTISQRALYYVFTPTAVTAVNRNIISGGSTRLFHSWTANNRRQLNYRSGSGGLLSLVGDANEHPLNTRKAIGFRVRAVSTSINGQTTLNGGTLKELTTAASTVQALTDVTTYRLGANDNSGLNSVTGIIHEIFMVSRSTTDDEQTQIVSYFQNKWGFT